MKSKLVVRRVCLSILAILTFGEVATAQSGGERALTGKTELIGRTNADNLHRSELNLFKGVYGDDESRVVEFQGGLGYLNADSPGQDLSYIGGVMRIPEFRNATFLFNNANELRDETDYQVKVDVLSNLSVNGGYSSTGGTDDTSFGGAIHTLALSEKLNLRTRLGYVDFVGTESFEGGALLFDKFGSLGFNWNEEQIRTGIGYREPGGLAFEALLIENSIGERNGPLAFLGHFTVKSNHPLLSNVARESRILGATSVSYENPILLGSQFGNPYVFSNFNRLQYVQDFGDQFNIRVRAFDLPGGGRFGQVQNVIFPFDLFGGSKGYLKNIYMGPEYSWTSGTEEVDRFGFLVGLRAIPLTNNLALNLFYENSGVFSGDEEEVHDVLAFLTYVL